MAAQLKTSHRDRLSGDELVRFMTCFGVSRGDARGSLTLIRSRTRRDYVTAGDLPHIQAWIGKGWIEAQRRRLGADFARRLEEQLGIDTGYDSDVLRDELMLCGYESATATELAARLLAASTACGSVTSIGSRTA